MQVEIGMNLDSCFFGWSCADPGGFLDRSFLLSMLIESCTTFEMALNFAQYDQSVNHAVLLSTQVVIYFNAHPPCLLTDNGFLDYQSLTVNLKHTYRYIP